MNTFDLLETRHHVKWYSEKIPPKETIEKVLWKTWKTTPSKNNAMPYKVFVYGPDKEKEKEKVWNMVYKNHVKAEQIAVEKGFATRTEDGTPNPYYEHIKYNPYLVCIHCQPREPNKFYQEQVKKGMFFDQAWPEYVDRFIDTSAVEAGMFIQVLTNYLLEEKIDVSYTSCFHRQVEKWQNEGLDHIKYRPIILLSIGYGERYRYEDLKRDGRTHEDIKPEYEEMIEWV